MNDNDIIKALECCLGIRGIESCSECPAYVGCNYCTEILRENALDLINRQKAEIERLQKYNTDVAFKHYNDGIKEFTERLKSGCGRVTTEGKTMLVCQESTVDYLVKKMTEKEK